MVAAIGDGLTAVIGWMGNVVDALTGAEGALNALLPLLGIGIAISCLFVGIKMVKSLLWAA